MVEQTTSGSVEREFGRYRILERLGEGAMGTVYRARDTQLDRDVALKMPKFRKKGDAGADVERFYHEARVAATIRHPNLCPVYDVDRIDGQHFISMAYIDGHPLSDYVKPGKPVTQKQAALVVRKIARALHVAHEQGIVHRDLKPSNIMIDQHKEPIVMDFGLARHVQRDSSHATADGTVVGTPVYMPPEQVRGEQDRIGPHSDVYSLGVILYELLTGEPPFHGPVTAVLGQVLTVEPPPPSTQRPELDPVLDGICQRALAKDIDDRFESMEAFAAELSDYLQGQSSVRLTVQRPATGGAATWPEWSRSRNVRWAGAGVLATIVLLVAFLVLRGDSPGGNRSGEPDGSSSAMPTAPGTILWQDDFESPDSPGRYSRERPSVPDNWFVSDGLLQHKYQQRVSGQEDLLLPWTVTGDVVAEITVVPRGPRVENANFVLGSLAFIYGGNGNRQTWMTGTGRATVTIPLDRSTRVQIHRIGETVTFDIGRSRVQSRQFPTLAHEPPVRLGFAGYHVSVDVAYDDLLVRRPTLAEYQSFNVDPPEGTGPSNGETVVSDPAEIDRVPTGANADFDAEREREVAKRIVDAGFVVRVGRFGFPDEQLAPGTRLPDEPFFVTMIGPKRKPDWQPLLPELDSLKRLQVLSFSKTKTPKGTLAAVANLRTLKVLGLGRTAIGPKGRQHLSQLKSLQWLNLTRTRTTDDGLQHLASLSDLRILWLSRTPVTDAGLKSLAGMKQLRNLDLFRTQIEGPGLEHIGQLPELRRLVLSQTSVRGESLAHIQSLNKLVFLNIQNCGNIGDDGTQHLRGLSALEVLVADHTQITDDGLEAIGAVERLDTLGLVGAPIEGAGLRHLARLKRLRHLNLSRTKLTDPHVKHLAAVASLQELFLANTSVSDIAVPDLSQLAGLRILQIMNTKITADGVAALRKALPGCRITH